MKKVYYNEYDKKAAAWLRELIKDGHIADGVVDERSILEVKSADLDGFAQCHFFAGIGGWSLALRLAGVPDDFPVWTGSCPCQPLSSAGLRKGHVDERHLWPAFHDLIDQRRPAAVFGEQVASADGREWFAGVRADMEGMGYACGGADLCSAGVGSPNIRQRLYWVADAQSAGGWSHNRTIPSCQTEGLRSAEGEDSGRSSIGAGRAGDCGPVSRLADTDGRDASAKGLQRSGQHGQPTQDDGTGRLVHADGERGRSGQPRREDEADAGIAGEAGGFWGRYDLLPCTDGKARRIEPGTFPLANGIPGRVGLLRGYGNAINPHVAALFIKACKGVLTG